MAGVEDTLDENAPLEKSESNDTPDSRQEAQVQNVIIDVFFDGTGNNMFNTDIRTETNPTQRQLELQEQLTGQISYENDYSNIVHLYKASTVNGTKKSIYIEGAGTTLEMEDDNPGLAMAWGRSGIIQRVKDAFGQAQDKAKEMDAKLITFNVYGFSRGAFYGRYFCAMLKETINYWYDPYDEWQLHERSVLFDEIRDCGRDLLDYDPYFLSINFVGIYDTVTSEGTSPNNDAIPFRQDIGSKQGINKIFHLTAQNEFRNHFPLEEINTAITQKNQHGKLIGYECSIPGAHADTGGGYIKPWTGEQNRYLSRFDRPRRERDLGWDAEIHWSWFMDRGYYSAEGEELQAQEGRYGDFEVKKRYKTGHGYETSLDQLPSYYEVYASREMPGNEYQFIGLNLMYEVAKQEGGVTFDNPLGLSTLQEHIESVEANADLKDFNQYALTSIKKNVVVGGKSKINLEDCSQLTKQQCQTIYHNYIHNTLVANMAGSWTDTKAYFVNGSNRNNKNANFQPRRIITKDNQGLWANRSATDNSPESN